ncbi:MAG: hypothetical protein GKR89_14550 [Candidatus Latescibacteria bacterium]|nr:hypothetical protein [Candidatus Latescibacterota bacterium]
MAMASRDEFLQQGFVIVRGVIPPNDLEPLRRSYEKLVERQRRVWTRQAGANDPPGGVWETAGQPRLHVNQMDGMHDGETAAAVEFWLRDTVQGVSSELLAEEDVPPTEMMLMCNPVSDHGPAAWHRDFSPSLTCPLMAYADDIVETGPRYVQWNIPLYDDDVLWVVPGSHLRPNTPAENASMRRDLRVPVPGGVQTHLRAGDGVAYILPILHWGSNYSPRTRRTIHGGFARLTHWASSQCFEHLSPAAQETYQRWQRRSVGYMDDAEAALRAVLAGDAEKYCAALDRLQPGRGEKGLVKSTICLSKTARNIHLQRCRQQDSLTDKETRWVQMAHPMTLQWGPPLGQRFTAAEALALWQRFKVVDACIQGDHENYLPGFQERDTRYLYEEVPAQLTRANWFGSWQSGQLGA